MQWLLLDTMWMCFSSLKSLHSIGRTELIFTGVRINWWRYLWSEKYYYYHRMCLRNGVDLRIWSFPQLKEHCTCQTKAVLHLQSLIHIWAHSYAWKMFVKWVFQVTLLTSLGSSLKVGTLQYPSNPAVPVTNQFPQALNATSQRLLAERPAMMSIVQR